MTPPTSHRVAAVASLWVAAAAWSCGGHPPAVTVPTPAGEEIGVSLFLVGDAGAPAPGFEPTLNALRSEAAAAPHAVVVFLGDNIYPRGLPDSTSPERPEAERRLEAQVAVLRGGGARGIFLPGNHDWDKMGAGGWEAIRREGRQVAAERDVQVTFLPGGGCPGPAVVDVGRTVRLVALDTQWWLQGGPKPRDPSSDCPADSEQEVADSMRSALATADGRQAVVMGHHPITSGGPHGGHFGWKDHLFPLTGIKPWLWIPLPVIGSIYPVARKLGVSNQDLSGPAYKRMRKAFAQVFAEYHPLVYAAGHDHNLQVIAGRDARYLLVSGGGIFGEPAPVGWQDSTRFARSASGYMRLDFLQNGRVRLGVKVTDAHGTGNEVFSMWLQSGGAP